MISSRFSPRSLEPAQLERLTVAREELLSRLQDAVTGAVVSGQARFDLVVGPRGAGKSHLIGVLQGRLRASPQLADRTIVIAPPEATHPLSLVQLLAQLLSELPDDPELGPTADAVRSLQRQRDGDQEGRAVALIRGRLGKRSMIVLLEDLDELFTALGREGQQRLRNILQTERRWSIVATSRSLSPSFTKYEAPFHGTFNVHRLEPLSPEQCRDMLAALADAHGDPQLAALLRTPKGLARARGLHHLLGGNPRAMALLFRQLDEHRLDHFELALGDLADELEPYFQEQMTRVSPMQRAIMELLAESWRPLTVTELVERSFSAQASISGALRHLRKEALVQSLEVGRERYYELGDPLLRLARANQRPRDAIAAFARVIRWWYDAADLGVRSTYVLPAPARAEFAVADRAEPDSAASLVQVIDAAWHHQRLDELLSATASLEFSIAALPEPTRTSLALLRARSEITCPLGTALRHDGFVARRSSTPGTLPPRASPSRRSSAPNEQVISERALSARTLDDGARSQAVPELLAGSTEHGGALVGVMLEALSLLAELPVDEWHSALPSWPGDPDTASDFALFFEVGFYRWLASRRPLAPLVRLADRLREVYGRECFPAGPLRSASPREAVARLSEAERSIIRELLVHHEDRKGLAVLALEAKR